jgi:hypothetical protein
MNIPKNTTYTDLWEGDFDKDGIKNIDDQRPFDKDMKKHVNKEVTLNTKWKDLKVRRKYYKNSTENLIILLGGQESRVKGMYSTIGKQMGRNIDHVQDMGAMRILTKSRRENKQKVREIEKMFPLCRKNTHPGVDCRIGKTDDKYKDSLKKGKVPYLGYHVNIRYDGRPHEVQIKCKEMQTFQDKMHPLYKKNDKQRQLKFRPAIMKLYKNGC